VARRDAAYVRRRSLGRVAIAAAMLLLVFSGINALVTHRRALQARQDVELALRIVSGMLNHV